MIHMRTKVETSTVLRRAFPVRIDLHDALFEQVNTVVRVEETVEFRVACTLAKKPDSW